MVTSNIEETGRAQVFLGYTFSMRRSDWLSLNDYVRGPNWALSEHLSERALLTGKNSREDEVFTYYD